MFRKEMEENQFKILKKKTGSNKTQTDIDEVFCIDRSESWNSTYFSKDMIRILLAWESFSPLSSSSVFIKKIRCKKKHKINDNV